MAEVAPVLARSIAEILGGKQILRLRSPTANDLRHGVEAGLPYASLEALMGRFRLSRSEVASVLGLPARTMARRKRDRRLRPDESDRLLRLARIAAEAARILGTEEKAAGWLRDENMALGGEVPLELLRTDIGARQVEEILGRIEYGLYS